MVYEAGQLHHWISSWLTEWHQGVIVDGESSDATPVKSGIPQDTVLGPLMFLVYITKEAFLGVDNGSYFYGFLINMAIVVHILYLPYKM